MMDASTGTTQKPSKAHGKCLKFTKMRLHRRPPPWHPPRKCLPDLTYLNADHILVRLPLWQAGPLSRNPSNVTVKTLTEVTEVTVVIEDTAIEDTVTDAVDMRHMKRTAWLLLRNSRPWIPTIIHLRRLRAPS